MKTPKTTPVKNMPTHGPGTYAFYKGSKCKILSIGGGKAKIMVNGQIKLVNYTSLDDEMYGTGVNLPINESEKQDAYQEFFKNKLKDYGVESPSELSEEDKSKFFSEIKSEWKGGSVNEAVNTKLLKISLGEYELTGEIGIIYGGVLSLKERNTKGKKIEDELNAMGFKNVFPWEALINEDSDKRMLKADTYCYFIEDNTYSVCPYNVSNGVIKYKP